LQYDIKLNEYTGEWQVAILRDMFLVCCWPKAGILGWGVFLNWWGWDLEFDYLPPYVFAGPQVNMLSRPQKKDKLPFPLYLSSQQSPPLF